MRNKIIFESKTKGERNMKRSIVILALVTAFVFAFGSVAQATFRGFTPIRNQAQLDEGILQGFITFPEARREMQRNFSAAGDFTGDIGATLQGTAHGGYVTTTTKCVVCHSAHRASGVPEGRYVWDGLPFGSNNANMVWVEGPQEGDASGSTSGAINLANARNQFFLTAGSTTCESCHVNAGGQASRLLVEWGGPYGTYTGGGPHGSPARGCVMCHNAGIHGLTGSSFNVMNVFMLGQTRGAIRGTTPNPAFNRDAQIRAEIENYQVLRGQTLDIPVNSSFDRAPVLTNPSAGSTWWYNGVRALGPMGGLPGATATNDLATTGIPGAPNANQFAAARSLATAYTCGETGCHVATAMFNLNWGMGFSRADYVRNPYPAASPDGGVQVGHSPAPGRDAQGNITPGHENRATTVTGHIMPSVRTSGSANQNQACGPCHGGNTVGFPTASTEPDQQDNTRRAFGCDQCHDMIGVATNTTAWPHGNRNIVVYEWVDGIQRLSTAGAGNLWMYGGNIARAEGSGNDRNAGGLQDHNRFVGPDPALDPGTRFADMNWLVLTGIGSGRYGLDVGRPTSQTWSADPIYLPPNMQPNPANPTVPSDGLLYTVNTGLTDGSCLKCHVAIDSASMNALGSYAADALYHGWRMGMDNDGNVFTSGGNADFWGQINPIWNGQAVSGSPRLFLYR